ncbi:MAG: histidine phosphatase family protein [Alphaproteobacteria bacterium]|nr:histidine phosphatase family protein [Alphaproteobacteria bacterium]
MAKLLLARHGNTFGPGDKVVWVGANEDLPLVARGEEQAHELGDALRAAKLVPTRIISGPLKRTRRAAEIVKSLCGFTGEIEIDQRLKEIDYGSWGGKSNEEIEAQFGLDALTEWDTHHRRPDGVDWSPSDADLKANALAAMADAVTETGFALVITSNGILRYMHSALTGDDANAKVKTGYCCAAEITGTSGARLFWNEKPDAALVAKTLS